MKEHIIWLDNYLSRARIKSYFSMVFLSLLSKAIYSHTISLQLRVKTSIKLQSFFRLVVFAGMTDNFGFSVAQCDIVHEKRSK